MDFSSKTVIVPQTGALYSPEDRDYARAVTLDYAENSLKTRISARFSQLRQGTKGMPQCKTLGASATYYHELETN
jgi:hypothetical protein